MRSNIAQNQKREGGREGKGGREGEGLVMPVYDCFVNQNEHNRHLSYPTFYDGVAAKEGREEGVQSINS